MKEWTRRSLVLGTAAIAAPVLALGIGKLWCQTNVAQRAQLRGLSSLMTIYPYGEVAAALGERYLRQAGLTALGALERLQANERLRSAAETGCLIKTMLVAQQACRDDFRS